MIKNGYTQDWWNGKKKISWNCICFSKDKTKCLSKAILQLISLLKPPRQHLAYNGYFNKYDWVNNVWKINQRFKQEEDSVFTYQDGIDLVRQWSELAWIHRQSLPYITDENMHLYKFSWRQFSNLYALKQELQFLNLP